MQYTLEMFEQLSDDAPDSDIERTARDLKQHHWEPLLLLQAPDFVHWKKQDMIDEFVRLTHLKEDDETFSHLSREDDVEDIVEKQLGMLIYYYEILCELRSGDAEAWDLVHELYEDD
ncbi:MAG: hypothetical protein PQJ47_05655 [Sphaerochaetaceae bacterium]|nr:hypothetical protein [Sphaerochaetaceae bacterium]